ncbi:acyltransferase family protein [Fructilactobacillus florum]|uniref:Acyltransferase 3 domain-containing protein n=1 Tax=Fructilactobacillus florum DSM 22689 = JCM 16035 TaxID=1423745 RepID=A0A0R2CI73_9LACO|nr:acyltransferase family protein [Fructilactobacillus florum]KRM91329.1 hypothetical protein FC87_GL001050 [Fructilactobacillus florum DSM 22689 = JCM 16035]
MEPKLSKNRFITGFTGMRALAVIGVILYHLNPTIFSGGYLGVPVFMTLSGYLVTDHLLHEYETTGKFRYGHFWYKRLKKLYPTLIVMLLLTATFITIFQSNLLANLWQSVVTNLSYVYNWYEIANGQSYFQQFAGTQSPFTHLWTLSIEGQFYLVWPLIVILGLSLSGSSRPHHSPYRGLLLITIGISIISVILMALLFKPGTDPSRIYYGTDTRMFSLLLGAALAMVWPSKRKLQHFEQHQVLFFDIVGLIGLSGMLILGLTVHAQSAFLYHGGMLLFSIFTVLLMWAVIANTSHWNRFLTNPVFNWLGSRSYEIYVYQLPVFVFFTARFKNVANHPISYALIELLLIISISELSYRFVQVPFSHYDYQRWFSQLLKLLPRLTWQSLILSIIAIIGLFGIVQSTTINPKQANHSQLAQRIQKNANVEKQHNQALAQKIKKGKAVQRSKRDQQAVKKNGLTAKQLTVAQNLSGSAIGDSVMLAGRDDLQAIFPKLYIDAQVARQAEAGIPTIKSLSDRGLLGKNVIIGLGTNGNVTADTINEIMQIIGDKRQVFWINVHVPTQPWQNSVNMQLAAAEKQYRNLRIINWNEYISHHSGLLASDQTHPTQSGSSKYASFIAKNVLKPAQK